MFNRIPSSSSASWISPDATASAAAALTTFDYSTVAASGQDGKRKRSDALPPRGSRRVLHRTDSSLQRAASTGSGPSAGPAFLQRSGSDSVGHGSTFDPTVATAWSAVERDRGFAVSRPEHRTGGVIISGDNHGPATSARPPVAYLPPNGDFSLNLPDAARAEIINADANSLLTICRQAVRSAPEFSRAIFTHAAGEIPRLGASGADIGELFDYLRIAISNIHPATMRLAPMIALTSQLADPRCASRMVSLGQERAYLALHVDIERVADVQCRDILKARWIAGLWMVNEPGVRNLLWTSMWEQRDGSTRRVELLEALSHSIKYLPQGWQMETAYSSLVEVLPSLPIAAQSIVLGNLVHVLASTTNREFQHAETRALLALAKRLPDGLESAIRFGLSDLSAMLHMQQRRDPVMPRAPRAASAADNPTSGATISGSHLVAGGLQSARSKATAIATARALRELPTLEACSLP